MSQSIRVWPLQPNIPLPILPFFVLPLEIPDLQTGKKECDEKSTETDRMPESVVRPYRKTC